jgi:hypothetical protein
MRIHGDRLFIVVMLGVHLLLQPGCFIQKTEPITQYCFEYSQLHTDTEIDAYIVQNQEVRIKLSCSELKVRPMWSFMELMIHLDISSSPKCVNTVTISAIAIESDAAGNDPWVSIRSMAGERIQFPAPVNGGIGYHVQPKATAPWLPKNIDQVPTEVLFQFRIEFSDGEKPGWLEFSGYPRTVCR